VRIVVIGAGAIGGVVGGRLAQHDHDVALVARGHHHDLIAADGLHVHDPTSKTVVRPPLFRSVVEAEIGDGDVVLLGVKSQDTVETLRELANCVSDAVPVVCLQNGVNNEREASRLFEFVYGGVVMCPTVYLEPGHVVAYSAPTTGIIDIGRFPRGSDATVGAIVDALASSTFSSEVLHDVARWKWAKLVTNLGNAIEAVCGPPARQGPLGDVVRDEALAVLDAAGIEHATKAEDTARRADHLHLGPVDGHRRPGGSSWQSLARGAGSIETDYLNGEIVMLGRLHGVPTPANLRLQELARELLTTQRGPGTIDDRDLMSSLRADA